MAVYTPQYEYDRIDRLIAEQFLDEDQQAVHDLVWPLIWGDGGLVKHILTLAAGSRTRLEHYVEMAKRDPRDVWMSGMMQIKTIGQIDSFNELCDDFGVDRDPELVTFREQLVRERESSLSQWKRRPWWKFW